MLIGSQRVLGGTMKQIHIHFVGTTDTYRSRMAAIYFRRIAPKGWVITSSGVSTTTAQQTLDAADIIIFVAKDAYDQACQRLNVDARKTLVWNLTAPAIHARRHGVALSHPRATRVVAGAMAASVKKHCDTLHSNITGLSWVDVMTKQNEPTGLRLPISWATDRGFWFRSVHVVLITPKGEFIIEKRSPIITFAPGKLDIGLGGIVDAGETPLQAAVRETHEELGIRLVPKQLKRVMMSRENAWHPAKQKMTRSMRYVFMAQLQPNQMYINTDPLEVNGIAILSRSELKNLLKTHRLRHVGQLSTSYRFYSEAVRKSLKIMKEVKHQAKAHKT